MSDQNQAALNRLSKYPLIRSACERRWQDAQADLGEAQGRISDALTSVLKGADGRHADRIAMAINHLAMAHVFLEAIKRSTNGNSLQSGGR